MAQTENESGQGQDPKDDPQEPEGEPEGRSPDVPDQRPHDKTPQSKGPPRRRIHRRTLAQELADTLTEEIVSGTRKTGDALPTEPELSAEFGVSRSVVRDATRILSARGLVDVRHGLGAFVTESQLDAFGEALFLALRRERASAWDVEEFFSTLLPEVAAMAAERANEEDFRTVRDRLEQYISTLRAILERTLDAGREASDTEQEEIRDGYAAFLEAVVTASHNKMFTLLFVPASAAHSIRDWESSGESAEELAALEARALRQAADAMESRDPSAARSAVARWFDLPTEAVDTLKATPVGEVPRIPVSIAEYARRRGLL